VENVLSICSAYINQDFSGNEVNKCQNCCEMTQLLKVLTMELKSAQSIIKILSEERHVEGRKTSGILPSCDSINYQTENHIEMENGSVWNEVQRKSRQYLPQAGLSPRYTVPITNRYASLENYEEPQKASSGSLFNKTRRPPSSIPHRNSKKFKESLKCKFESEKLRQATSGSEEQTIPTIVNGVICVNNKGKLDVNCNDLYVNNINTLSQVINTRKGDNHVLGNKHRVILIGDSHLRGYGCSLTSLLSKNYELYSIIKPGANSNELNNSAKEVIGKLSHDDLIIIGYGSNDFELNKFSKVLGNIHNFLQNNKHTNIAVMNVPSRYDLSNSTSVNDTIFNLNKKIKKIVETSPNAKLIEIDNNRNLFTNHGLHRNKLGKRLTTYVLADFIQTSWKQKVQAPIPLGWLDVSCDKDILVCKENLVKAPIRSSNRSKKTPVTRSQDFLWVP
jgi:hypothetical protein